jgi:creatinine amidohydrolase
MPMATDEVIADYFAGALAEKIAALIWPTLSYGAYPAFVAYAGSVSLSSHTFQAVVTEIADALLGFGASRVIILHTGLSTIAPVDAAVGATRDPSRVRHVKLFTGPRFEKTAAALKQQPYGTHADEIETSLMLAIAPDLVDLTRTEPMPFSTTGPARGPLSPDDPSAPNYSPSGSFGDPTLASADKGSRLLAAMLEDMLEAAE